MCDIDIAVLPIRLSLCKLRIILLLVLFSFKLWWLDLMVFMIGLVRLAQSEISS